MIEINSFDTASAEYFKYSLGVNKINVNTFDNLSNWLAEYNSNGKYYLSVLGAVVYFEYEEDLLWFKLKWDI